MRSEAVTNHGTRGVLVFPVGDDFFGARVEEVAGLIEADRLAPLPRQHGALAGVVAFRGGMVPALDLSVILDFELPPHATRYAIVLARGPERFALLVPALPRLIPARELKGADVPADGTDFGSLLETMYRAGETDVHCLDYWSIFESIMAPVEPAYAGAPKAT